jgi:glycosyltransferase involved in cell wall biosynthesis
MKIAALPGDVGACGYYRVIAPMRALERNGMIDEWWLPPVTKTPSGHDEMKVTNQDVIGYDLAVFQRQPEQRITDLMWMLQQSGTRVVFDIDDDLFSVPPDNAAYLHWGRDWRKIGANVKAEDVGVFVGDGKSLDRQKRRDEARVNAAKGRLEMTHSNRAGLLQNIRGADLVSVSTPKLQQVYSPYRKSVRVLPNQIEPRDWEEALTHPYERNDDQVWIGWAGSKTHWPDLKILKAPVLDILRRHAEARFCIVGMPEAAVLFGDRAGQMLTWDWMSLEEYRSVVAAFDIIVAPSAPKTFNEAKSDLRVLEAGLCGKPIVASPTTYGDTIRESGGGYVASSVGKWIKYLDRLVRNEGLRRALGEKGREYVLENRTYDGNAWRWAEAYGKLVA